MALLSDFFRPGAGYSIGIQKAAVPGGYQDLGASQQVTTTEQIGSQAFFIEVFGLNINTVMNVYLDGKKLPSNYIQPRGKNLGDPLSTDEDGSLHFYFYYRDSVPNIKNVPEAAFLDEISKNTRQLLVVVLDKASIDDATLPETFRRNVRCYAEKQILRTYDIQLTTVRDVIDTRTGGKTTTTVGSVTITS